MPSIFQKCLNEDRTEASYFAAIFSIFSALATFSAVFNDQWITIRTRPGALLVNATRSGAVPIRPILPICSKLGARLFWHTSASDAFHDYTLPDRYVSSLQTGDAIYVSCISQLVAMLFYASISLCFVMMTLAVLSAAFHVLLPTPKFLDWLRRNLVLEICNGKCLVCLMFAICALTWRAKRELENQQRHDDRPAAAVDVCVGNGMFYIICSGAFSCIAALFSVYQRRLAGQTRRARNQRFICTRALRSWRDHVENSRISSAAGVSRPTELERYLLDACQTDDGPSTSASVRNSTSRRPAPPTSLQTDRPSAEPSSSSSFAVIRHI